jgi:3-isopropylmalate/(R)-2-methylmalate dehydratase small subunit
MSVKETVIREIAGRGIVLRGNDIDTDRIIPARYLKSLSFEELGEYCFYDQRFDSRGRALEHPMNDPRFSGASVLLVNKNFGCGSSREHAPQALMHWGIRGIIGESFAEIFAGNCTALGLPTLSVTREATEELMRLVETAPNTEIRIDLRVHRIQAGSVSLSFQQPASQSNVFLSGTWDTTTSLLEGMDAIEARAAEIPYLKEFPYPRKHRE